MCRPPSFRHRILAGICTVSWLGHLAAAGIPNLVKDINPQETYFGRGAGKVTMAGSKAVFSAHRVDAGTELWSSDGTPQGTALLKDIYPELGSSFPSGLMAMGGNVYFAADDGIHGSELWRSDGTAAGTTLFADLKDGPQPASPEPVAASSNRLWFKTTNADPESFRCTDGTPEGTVILNPDGPSGRAFINPRHFVVSGGILYFAANGSQLWKSDGTVEGTVKMAQATTEPAGNEARIEEIVAVGSDIYFAVSNTGSLRWLWRSGENPGTAQMIPRDNATSWWRFLSDFRSVGDKLFFYGQEDLSVPGTFRCGDGTSAGSVLLSAMFEPGSFRHQAVMGGLLYFSASQPATGMEVWKTDGTVAGTVLVKDIAKGSYPSEPGEFCVAGSWLYFSASDRKKGQELWRTDGTTKGTRMVFETQKGSAGLNPGNMTADGQGVYFHADPNGTGDLWHSDGTARGSGRLTKSDSTGVSGLEAGPFAGVGLGPRMIGVGETVFFRGNDGRLGSELWASTGKKTKIVQDLRLGFDSSNPENFTRLGKRALFSANAPNGRLQVWVTDGKLRGTFPITNFPVTPWGAHPANFVANENQCFFTAGEQPSNALWVTDGSGRNGTREVTMPGGGSFNVVAGSPTLLGPLLYFVDDQPLTGRSVWRTDGTSGGTRLLTSSAGENLFYSHFTPTGTGGCFFVTNGGITSLWVTDGSEAGTREVPETPVFQNIKGAIPLDTRFAFIASTPILGNRLWISDGTTEGTRVLLDVPVGNGLSSARIGTALVIALDDHVHGREVWRTDGTPEGTSLILDIRDGSDGSSPSELIAAGGRVYFSADDGVHGRELWCTDGTPEGTFLTGETMPGPPASNPTMLTVAGSRLYFGAEDPGAGYELHSLDLNTVSPPVLAASRQAPSIAPHSVLAVDEPALLRRAFNLPPDQSGSPALSAGNGTAGFPEFATSNGFFQVTYLRLKDGSLSYVPKWSVSLDSASFQPMSGPESVTEIDAQWERVTASEPIPPGTLRMFGIVEVTGNP